MTPYVPSLIGGMLIGLSAVMLLLLNGRIAGISGMSFVALTVYLTDVLPRAVQRISFTNYCRGRGR